MDFKRRVIICPKCNDKVMEEDYSRHKSENCFQQSFKQTSLKLNEKRTVFTNVEEKESNSNYNSIKSVKYSERDGEYKDEYNRLYGNLDEGHLTFGARSKVADTISTTHKLGHNTDKLANSDNNSMNNNFIGSFKKSNIMASSINKGMNHADLLKAAGSIVETKEESEYPERSSKVSYNPICNGAVGIINDLEEHNSFLSTVVHALWYLPIVRNYILYELFLQGDRESLSTKNRTLKTLQALFLTIQSTPVDDSPIMISDFRHSLAQLFGSRRKFLTNCPDDPVDAFYAIINMFHSKYAVNFNITLLRKQGLMKSTIHLATGSALLITICSLIYSD